MIAPLLLSLVVAGTPTTTSVSSSPWAPGSQVLGGVLAPARLPAGTIALYGLVGAPEVGAGFRQGLDLLELEARGLFNVLEVSLLLEGGVKLTALKRERLLLAPALALGLKLNSGSRYYDVANFGSVALRPRLGAALSYAFTELVSGLATVEVPWAISLGVQGSQVTPQVGAGAEFHLGGSLSLLAAGSVGFDVLEAPGSAAIVRPAWGVRLGLGYRVF